MPQITVTRLDSGGLTAAGDSVCTLGHVLPERRGIADGVYAGWNWTGTELLLQSDRYGLFPLFVSTDAKRCVVASDLTLVLDAQTPIAFDYDALSVFLRLGFFVGDDTPFAGVRAVPPGATLNWSRSGPSVTGRYPVPSTHALTRDEAIDAFISRMNQAIASRLSRAPFTLPLDGDCESRHILFALVAARCAPEACITLEDDPDRGDGEVAVTAAICSRLGIPHVKVPPLGERGRLEREKNRRTHFCTEALAQVIALADYLRDVTDVTYHRIGGDLAHWSDLNGEMRRRYEGGGESALAAYLLDGYGDAVSDDALAQLLSRDMLREVPRERAIARLQREIARHLDAPNPVSSFIFWNRTRRATALLPFALMRDIRVYAPFLDPGVFDLLAGLPAAMLMDGAFHTDAVARAYPRLADIPYASRCRRMRRRTWERRFARDLIRDLLHAPTQRSGGLLPRAVATVLDADSDRLWYAPLAVYLAQLGALADRDR